MFQTGLVEAGMAQLVRALDWSTTPLGPADAWPQSLRTTVSTCLRSRFPILIWWGPELVKIYNDAYRPMLGDKHPAALGRRGREVWPEIWDIIGPMLQGVLDRGEATWSENQMLPLVRKGFAEECYFTFSYSPIEDESGGVGGVFTAVTEVTEQVLGARRIEVLRALATCSAEAENLFDACRCAAAALATDAADVPFALVYLLDPAGGLELAGVHGLEPNHALAPTSCAADSAPWRMGDALRSGRPIVLQGLDRELPGGPWPEHAHAAVVQSFSAAGRALGVLVTGVSPRLALDDHYRQFHELLAVHLGTLAAGVRAYELEKNRAQALAEIDRAKTAFFSNISHEFRTPLTLIVGPTEEALRSADGNLCGEDLQAVHGNAKRLLKLVNQLLDFSRIEASRARATLRPTDLAALTTDLASAFRSAVERAGLGLHVDCLPLAEPVLVDPEMWEKIVLNLLSNAFKFTLQGTITVELRAHDEHVELRVRDTGSGIPEHELPHVFDRFHRIEGAQSRTHEGSGIGLSLVRDLVCLLEGEIDVSSRVGVGTEVVVRIPRLAHDRFEGSVVTESTHARPFVEEALGWLPSETRATEAAPDPTPIPRVLLADDNADMRAYLRRLLEQRWDVVAVHDGVEALEEARRRVPDVIVADIMMPRLDGFGLLRSLRSDDALRTIPVVLLSARAGEEATAEGLAAGANDYIVKPFVASNVLARVEAQLASARSIRTAEAARQAVYRAIMEAPAAFCVLRGESLVIAMANDACLAMWGKTREILGRPLLHALPEIRDEMFPRLLADVMHTGTPYRAESTLARVGLGTEDGAPEQYFDFLYAPITEADGSPSGVIVLAVDVTARVTAQHALEEALHAAQIASESKDQFLALLGHELRNPLAPIVTAVELMKMRGGGGMDRECAVIERQARHLTRLVDDLLDVARIARGKVELDRVPLAVADVLDRSVETVRPLLQERRHQLAVHVDPDLYIDADPIRMAQVVTNLLSNAAKYTPDEGYIEVSARRERGDVVIIVRDDGVGISGELLPHVFDIFTQERQPLDRAKGGLGLGLSIVKSLVVQHGGSVTAHSNGPGKGSTFEVRLPELVRGAPTTRAGAGRGAADVAARRRRVLVVDDNVDAAEVLAATASALGHQTRMVHDGPSALQLAHEFQPDVALIDIGLPEMDGWELGRRLRADARLRDMRMIAVTGYGRDSDRRRSTAAGFDAHMVKPVDVDQLARILGIVGACPRPRESPSVAENSRDAAPDDVGSA